MAHNINFNEDKQQYSFFSVKEKAWHNLGQIVQDYPNSKEALQFAGLDFEVLKRPNTHKLDNGEEIISANSLYTYRPDNNAHFIYFIWISIVECSIGLANLALYIF